MTIYRRLHAVLPYFGQAVPEMSNAAGIIMHLGGRIAAKCWRMTSRSSEVSATFLLHVDGVVILCVFRR